MTHEEMSNFTYAELSNFSHLELSLERVELLNNIIKDFRDDIPSGIIIRLERLGKKFLASCENNNIEIPSEVAELKHKKHWSVIDILSILSSIITIITAAISMFSPKDKTIDNTYINNVTNYTITEEYITNVNIIINELEQTYNISIDTEYTSKNSDSEN